MTNNVVLIHGWSATSSSMGKLVQFLQANGMQVTQLWLGDYISLDDDVRVADVARRMDVVLRDTVARGELTTPFDMIVHSTGGLVSREWLVSHGVNWAPCPLRRLLMLAPANFGSKLAAVGKSMIGRIAKGWNNWFQTGEQMLRELELGSPYQWSLARRDLLADTPGQPSPYGPGKVLAFVICGSHGYASGLEMIANEAGADGTVRPAAANLNISSLTIDFSSGAGTPDVREWMTRTGAERIAFAILPDRSHASILDPQADVGSATSGELATLILEALRCDDQGYPKLCSDWDIVSEQTFALANKAAIAASFKKHPPDPTDLHQYLQVLTHVRDDQGEPVSDYFLEFFSPQVSGEQDSVDFHRLVLKDVHVNTIDPSYRCLFADRTALFTDFYKGVRTQVAMSISAAKLGPNIRYFDKTKEGAKGELVVHERDDQARTAMGAPRLRHNRTHLVDIVIPRRPIDKVFTLKR